MDFSWINEPAALVALLSLVALEIVLGIDNIIFISILTGKLPEHQRAKARQLGLTLALVTRILFLLGISWILGLGKEVISIAGKGFSWRDIILLVGGLLLIFKAVREIHDKLEGAEHVHSVKTSTFTGVIAQILLLDVVFSIDSVLTAVGMVKQKEIMIISVIVAIIFMLAFAGKVSSFVEKHPTIKMLALAFLVLIGVNLIAEGFGQHIEKGYTYFALVFATTIEMLNIRLKGKAKPVELHNVPKLEGDASSPGS